MTTTDSDPTSTKRPRIYPYFDLSVALTLAEKVYKEGGGSVDKRQLAELLGVGKGSSTEMRIISAIMFGLVSRREQRIETTELGRRAVSPVNDGERAIALSDAFDHVGLFASVRKRFAGQPLPTDAGIKTLMVRDLEVLEKHKNEAFNTMMKSAKEAGILRTRQTGTYLTTLAGHGAPNNEQADEPQTPAAIALPSVSQVPAKTTLGLHPSIQGLVDELAKDAPTWDADRREIWEAAFSGVLDYVFPKTKRPRSTTPVDPNDLPFE